MLAIKFNRQRQFRFCQQLITLSGAAVFTSKISHAVDTENMSFGLNI